MWPICWWDRILWLKGDGNEVDRENEEWAIVRRYPETSWMRVETNCRVGRDICSNMWTVTNPHHIVMYRAQTPM